MEALSLLALYCFCRFIKWLWDRTAPDIDEMDKTFWDYLDGG